MTANDQEDLVQQAEKIQVLSELCDELTMRLDIAEDEHRREIDLYKEANCRDRDLYRALLRGEHRRFVTACIIAFIMAGMCCLAVIA
jgi:hypothetical protein